MTPQIEALYQQIGQEAVEIANIDRLEKLLIYAEVAEDWISADIIFRASAESTVWLVFCPPDMRDRITQLWQLSKAAEGHEWRVMMFAIDGSGRFAIDFQYPADIDADEHVSRRRPRAVERFFGTPKVQLRKN
jgi:hypothetical protein